MSSLENPPSKRMNRARALLLGAVLCAALAWFTGPFGRLAVTTVFLLVVPGYLIERFLRSPSPAALFARPALWLGLSLSVTPLCYQWTTLAGLPLTTQALTALATTLALGGFWSAWRELAQKPEARSQKPEAVAYQNTLDTQKTGSLHPPAASAVTDRNLLLPRSHASVLLPQFGLLALLALTLWTRFSQLSGLAFPPWVDSVHHALLIRVIAERGVAPLSLEPYMPVQQLAYHWGYHVVAAAVMQLSGVALPETMLWFGQILNTLTVGAYVALASYLWRRPAAGLVAGLIVGLISIMPAYYLSWGRYTQLTGLLILAPLAMNWRMLLDTWGRGAREGRGPQDRRTTEPQNRRLIGRIRTPVPGGVLPQVVPIAVLLAGLSLIHARVLVFAFALLLVMYVVWIAGHEPGAGGRLLVPIGLAGMLALLLAGPWLRFLADQSLLRIVARPGELAGSTELNTLNLGLLWAGQNRLLIALGLVAALWELRHRARPAVEQVLWLGLLVVLANPWLATYILPAAGASLAVAAAQQRRWWLAGAGLALLLVNPALVSPPGTWVITNDVVAISLFVPISILLGGAAARLWEWLGRSAAGRRHRAATTGHQRRLNGAQWIAACGLAGITLWSTWDLRGVVNPATVLATEADRQAIAWAAEHTSPNARFLINAAPWLPGVARGEDGGWWLLPLAGRWTSTPPVLFFYGPPDYVREVRARNELVAAFQPGQEQRIADLIAREGITHIYLGTRTGRLTPATFADNPNYEVVYEHDGVTILAVRR